MYKVYHLLLIPLLLSGFLTAHAQATESIAEINKVKHPVFKNTYAYPPEIVEGALLQKLQTDHIRAQSHKHSITCRGVVYPVLAATPLDLYFQTEGRSKRGSGTATLKMFVSKGRDNFIGEKYDPELSQKALDFLNNLKRDVDYYALKQEIYQKEKDLNEARSDYKKRLKDKQKLTGKEYDLKRALSSASDVKKQKKIRKKIKKITKKTHSTNNDLHKAERDLEQRKGEIQALRSRLMQMYETRESKK